MERLLTFPNSSTVFANHLTSTNMTDGESCQGKLATAFRLPLARKRSTSSTVCPSNVARPSPTTSWTRCPPAPSTTTARRATSTNTKTRSPFTRKGTKALCRHLLHRTLNTKPRMRALCRSSLLSWIITTCPSTSMVTSLLTIIMRTCLTTVFPKLFERARRSGMRVLCERCNLASCTDSDGSRVDFWIRHGV
jgi:hypothetical protein